MCQLCHQKGGSVTMEEAHNKQAVSIVMDTDTGLVVDEFFEGDSYRKVTAEQRAYNLNHKKIQKPVSFTKIDDNICKILAKEKFTSAETSILFSIIPYIGYYKLSGLLIKRKGTNFCELLNCEDVKNICSYIPERTFKRGMAGLIKKQILVKKKDGRDNVYYANPFIFFKGETISIDLYNKFKKTKWNIYDKK